MASRHVGIINLDRSPLRVGSTNIPAAKQDPEPTLVDLTDGKVRRDLKRFGDRLQIVETDRNIKRAVVSLTAGVNTGGGVFAWQNPEGRRIHVLRVDLDVTTIATAAGVIDVGTTATSATTSSDNLIDGLDLNAGTGLFSSTDDTDNGTNGKAKGQVLASGKWITASRVSGATTGVVGKAIITYSVVA